MISRRSEKILEVSMSDQAAAREIVNEVNDLESHVNKDFLKLDGTTSPTTDINWGNHKITRVASPTDAQDVVNKDYVDNNRAIFVLQNYGDALSGTYFGTVVMFPGFIQEGDTTIYGDLIVEDNLVNGHGYSLTVFGNVYVANSILFSTSLSLDPLTPQGNFFVSGDLKCSYLNFEVNPGQSPQLTVLGDLTVINNGVTDCFGRDGADGLLIQVGGTFSSGRVDMHGGNSTNNDYFFVGAGNGGSLGIGGNLICSSSITLSGGDTGFDNLNAGNGGLVIVNGNITAVGMDLHGGTSNPGINASGASAGAIYALGNIVTTGINLIGGDCDSSNLNDIAGLGGIVNCSGEITGGCTIQANGGNRTGTISSPGTVQSPNGGTILSAGNIVANLLQANGGSNTSVGPGTAQVTILNFPSFAEQAQYIVVTDATTSETWAFWLDINNNGTQPTGSTFTSANHQIKVSISTPFNAHSVASVFRNSMIANLTNLTASAISGFLLQAAFSMTQNIVGAVPDIFSAAADGTSPTSITTFRVARGLNGPAANSFGGNGGTINSQSGNISAQNISIMGGQAAGSLGGNGGSISCGDRLYCAGAIDVSGGASDYINGGAGSIGSEGTGMYAQTANLMDGNGTGAAPTNTVHLAVAGNTVINNLNMADRPEAIIVPLNNDSKVQLSIGTMSAKTTLNNSDNSPTGDISGHLQDSLFIYDPVGNWFYLEGTSI